MFKSLFFTVLLLILVGAFGVMFNALMAFAVAVGAVVAFVVISGLNNPHMDDDET
jgi:hypothetical protein